MAKQSKQTKTPVERFKELMDKAHVLAQDNNIQLISFWCDIDSAGRGQVDAAMNCERPFVTAIVEQLGSILRKTTPTIEKADDVTVADQ